VNGSATGSSFVGCNFRGVDALLPTGVKIGKIQVTTPGGTGTSATNFVLTQQGCKAEQTSRDHKPDQ